MPQKRAVLVEVKCKTCNVGFMVMPCHRISRKYCTQKCAYASKDRTRNNKKKDYGTKVCLECNSVFVVTSQCPKKKFCCHKCAASNIGRTSIQIARAVPRPPLIGSLVKCESCVSLFYKTPKSKQRFCCKKCAIPAISKKSSATMVANGYYKSSTPFSRSKYGWCEVGGKRFFSRSSWERAYAWYLQFLKESFVIKDWSYEPETIKFPKNEMALFSYTPDFYVVTDTGVEIHEVKGWLTTKGKAKLDLMERYFPMIKLIIIGRKWFEAKENKKYLDAAQ